MLAICLAMLEIEQDQRRFTRLLEAHEKNICGDLAHSRKLDPDGERRPTDLAQVGAELGTHLRPAPEGDSEPRNHRRRDRETLGCFTQSMALFRSAGKCGSRLQISLTSTCAALKPVFSVLNYKIL